VSRALIALARDYMALPGAPNMADVLFAYHREGTFYRRDENGMLWLDAGRPDALLGDWIPDLTDASTGGSLLPLLGPGWTVYQRVHDGVWEVSRPDGEHRQEGATLAEAVARVAVALGRA
jgi:hypothetical protein